MYEIRLQKAPQKTLKQLANRAKPRFDKISEVMTELMNDPLSISLALQDPLLKGFRRAKAGDDRIIETIRDVAIESYSVHSHDVVKFG